VGFASRGLKKKLPGRVNIYNNRQVFLVRKHNLLYFILPFEDLIKSSFRTWGAAIQNPRVGTPHIPFTRFRMAPSRGRTDAAFGVHNSFEDSFLPVF